MTAAWYLLLLLIPIAGIHIWAAHKWKGAIVWWESAVGIVAGGLLSWGCIALGQAYVGHDTETLSGSAYKAVYIPEWKSNETRTTTDKKGRTRTVHYVETHSASYKLESDIGEFRIKESTWDTLCETHGSATTTYRGSRPNYRSGDRNDYHMDLSVDGGGDDDLIPIGLGRPDFPVTRSSSWTNKLEQSDSLLKLPELKKGEAQRLKLPSYPKSTDGLEWTNRVVGSGAMNVRAWDRLNALLGPSKKVNLIIVYLGEGSTVETAMKLRQHWRNGKKNDLVLCVDKRDATWSYVFGWAKSDLIKQSLASVLRSGPVDKSLIPAIKDAVWDDFEPYDWHKIENLPLQVPVWALILAIAVTGFTQWGFVVWASTNEFTRSSPRGYRYRY